MSTSGPAGQAPAAPTNLWNTALYDDRHSFVWKYGAEVVELLAPQPGERILDVGCGTGHLAAAIAAAGAGVTGFDAAQSMVEQARALYPAIPFVQADAADFHFDEPFDAVFSNATLHWVPRAAGAAACIAAALNPGGRFVAEFGGKGNTRAVLAAIAGARQAAGFTSGVERSPWYYPSIAEYATLLEQVGLSMTFARLFDRPTPLEGGESGLRNWLEMFAGRFFSDLPAGQIPAVLAGVEEGLRPVWFRDGAWVIDYRRLRFVAVKD